MAEARSTTGDSANDKAFRANVPGWEANITSYKEMKGLADQAVQREREILRSELASLAMLKYDLKMASTMLRKFHVEVPEAQGSLIIFTIKTGIRFRRIKFGKDVTNYIRCRWPLGVHIYI